jgi:hypothetical protein
MLFKFFVAVLLKSLGIWQVLKGFKILISEKFGKVDVYPFF